MDVVVGVITIGDLIVCTLFEFLVTERDRHGGLNLAASEGEAVFSSFGSYDSDCCILDTDRIDGDGDVLGLVANFVVSQACGLCGQLTDGELHGVLTSVFNGLLNFLASSIIDFVADYIFNCL